MSASELKVNSRWSVRYDNKEWTYQYSKETSKITPYILKNDKFKITLFLQTEAHYTKNMISDKQLMTENCKSPNNDLKFVIEKINTTETCYIEYINLNNQTIAQYAFVNQTYKHSYDLNIYSWIKENEKQKEAVNKLLKGFIK